jgi:hypothetical protein
MSRFDFTKEQIAAKSAVVLARLIEVIRADGHTVAEGPCTVSPGYRLLDFGDKRFVGFELIEPTGSIPRWRVLVGSDHARRFEEAHAGFRYADMAAECVERAENMRRARVTEHQRGLVREEAARISGLVGPHNNCFVREVGLRVHFGIDAMPATEAQILTVVAAMRACGLEP